MIEKKQSEPVELVERELTKVQGGTGFVKSWTLSGDADDAPPPDRTNDPQIRRKNAGLSS